MRSSQGDLFKFKDGYGVALNEHHAFLISGGGKDLGYKTQVGSIPADAAAATRDEMPFEVWFALEAVAVVTAHEHTLN
jgi:hypothetical protein